MNPRDRSKAVRYLRGLGFFRGLFAVVRRAEEGRDDTNTQPEKERKE